MPSFTSVVISVAAAVNSTENGIGVRPTLGVSEPVNDYETAEVLD
jgi:hypothetical protein